MKRKLKPETEIRNLKRQLLEKSRDLSSLKETLRAVIRRAEASEHERDHWRELANEKDKGYPVVTFADIVAEGKRMRHEGLIVDNITPFGPVSVIKHPLLEQHLERGNKK
jgi:hypothetical protein